LIEKGDVTASSWAALRANIVLLGFDIQAELQVRGASPTTARPQHSSPAPSEAPIAQQAMLNRHQQAMRQPTAAGPKLEQAFDPSASMQAMRDSPSSNSHSRSASSSQFPSPAQDYRESPATYSNQAPYLPQVQAQAHQQQPQQHQPQQQPSHHVINEGHHHGQPLHQQPSAAQYSYGNNNNGWEQPPFRGPEQHFQQQDMSSYGVSDVHSYGNVSGMQDSHHSQMMHHGGTHPAGKLTRPFSLPMS